MFFTPFRSPGTACCEKVNAMGHLVATPQTVPPRSSCVQTLQPAKRPLPVAPFVIPVRHAASGERVIVMVRLRVLTGCPCLDSTATAWTFVDDLSIGSQLQKRRTLLPSSKSNFSALGVLRL